MTSCAAGRNGRNNMRVASSTAFAIVFALFNLADASAAVLCSSADGRGVEVNNVWCNTERNFENRGVTQCLIAQHNNAPMNVRLYVRSGRQRVGQQFRAMPPGVVYKAFWWRDYQRPSPICFLDWPSGTTRIRHQA